jgi:hypothetical protein
MKERNTFLRAQRTLRQSGSSDHKPPIRLTVNTQVNVREINVASVSDDDLVAYKKLLLELRSLLAPGEPKALPRVVRQ